MGPVRHHPRRRTVHLPQLSKWVAALVEPAGSLPAATAGLMLALAGCMVTADSLLTDSLEERPTWRDAEERACLARRGTTLPTSMTQLAKIVGPGGCGIEAPLQISAFADGTVAVGLSRAQIAERASIAKSSSRLSCALAACRDVDQYPSCIPR